jgi:N-acetylglutamate synthase-like GNAT family acetyltransferase
MEITSIEKENFEYFEPYTGGPLTPEQSALGLIEDDTAIGALVVSEDDGVCTIDSLFVDPGYQRKGGGTMLLNALKECSEELEIRDFLVYYSEDEAITAFLTKQGFTCIQGDEVMTISVNKILSSNNFQKVRGKEPEEGIRCIKDLARKDLNGLKGVVQEAGFPEKLLANEDLDAELSFAAFDGEKPEGILLANKVGENIFVSLLLVEENNQGILRKLLAAFSNALSHHAKKESLLQFVNRNEKLRSTLEKMIGQQFDVTGQTWTGILSI